MPRALVWTDEWDDCARSLRAVGTSYDEIAQALGISRNAAVERCRKIGAVMVHQDIAQTPAEDPERESLCAGHPTPWDLLVAGTADEGHAYPVHQPFTRREMRRL